MSAACIGVDVGGTAAKLGLVTGGEIRARRQVPTGREIAFDELIERLAAAVGELQGEVGTGRQSGFGESLRGSGSGTQAGKPAPLEASAVSNVMGIGVAAPGFAAPDGSGVINVTNLPQIDGQPLRDALAATTGLPVVVDNDANAAALGEFRFGAGGGVRRLLVVTIGTGIGAGMVVDGAVLRASWQGLGDPGHVTVLRDGPRCACGAVGCMESIAATPGTLRRAAELGGEFADFSVLAARGVAGEGPARAALRESGAWIGMGLTTLTHLLAPERILLGGGAMDAAGEILMPAIEASYDHHVQPFLRRRLTLGRAALGNDAGVLGAAALVSGNRADV